MSLKNCIKILLQIELTWPMPRRSLVIVGFLTFLLGAWMYSFVVLFKTGYAIETLKLEYKDILLDQVNKVNGLNTNNQ